MLCNIAEVVLVRDLIDFCLLVIVNFSAMHSYLLLFTSFSFSIVASLKICLFTAETLKNVHDYLFSQSSSC